MYFPEFRLLVSEWGRQRGIFEHGTIEGQAQKALEECGELVSAAAILQVLTSLEQQPLMAEARKQLVDAMGDVLVCLIMVGGLAGITHEEAMQEAWDSIKDRKGQMKADGKFHKE